MLLMFSVRVAEWPPVLGQSCSFSLLCVSFVHAYHFLCALSFPFGFEGGMWDSIVLNYDHLPFYLLCKFEFLVNVIKVSRLSQMV